MGEHKLEITNYTQHQYHLVDPSPLPIISAFSACFLAIAAVMFMHKIPYAGWLLKGGFAMVGLCMFFWWKDVIKEAIVQKAHSLPVKHGLRFGMALFILSEVMFFAAFFWAFFHASIFPSHILDGVWPAKEGIWPPEGIKTFDPWHLPYLNTLILLLSGTTVTWAHYSLLENNRRDLIRALAITVILGISFSVLQAYEYHHAAFGFKDGIYASNFYMATGFHGAHVIIGTIFLAVCLFRSIKGHFSPESHLGFEFAAWYWHFVDVVWLFLFIFVYWWGGGSH